MRRSIVLTVATSVFLFGSLVLAPEASAAVWNPNQPLVPCGGSGVTNAHPCGFNDLIQLAQNFITFLFWLAVPVSVALFAYAGWLYLVSGSGMADKRTQAKDIFWNVVKGIIFMAIAWLVVYLITDTLLDKSYKNNLLLLEKIR